MNNIQFHTTTVPHKLYRHTLAHSLIVSHHQNKYNHILSSHTHTQTQKHTHLQNNTKYSICDTVHPQPEIRVALTGYGYGSSKSNAAQSYQFMIVIFYYLLMKFHSYNCLFGDISMFNY